MAIITDEHASTLRFACTPVARSEEGPYDAYDLAVWDDGHQIFAHQYNVNGWQAGHSEVWKTARAFQASARLVDATVPVDLWDLWTKHPDFGEPMTLALSVPWMKLILSGTTTLRGAPPEIDAEIYLWTDNDRYYEPNVPSDSRLRNYACLRMTFGVEEARAFGRELATEYVDAQKRRRALGIHHYDDHLDFC